MKVWDEFRIEKSKQLGAASEQLDKRLQEHIRMLRQNESTLGSSKLDVLEYDSAKNRADTLAEILRVPSSYSIQL